MYENIKSIVHMNDNVGNIAFTNVILMIMLHAERFSFH